jgi:hypothetical protein
LDHAADTLRMLRGAQASRAEAAALDTYLVTVCDHGLNASTFAARVTASTLAGLTSAVLSGISTLKGPLHGGAPGPVIEMLNEIGEVANARPWIEQALARGDRLMGFGHRIYRVRDPRADALKRAVRTLTPDAGLLGAGRLALAEAVEQAALAILRELLLLKQRPGVVAGRVDQRHLLVVADLFPWVLSVPNHDRAAGHIDILPKDSRDLFLAHGRRDREFYNTANRNNLPRISIKVSDDPDEFVGRRTPVAFATFANKT